MLRRRLLALGAVLELLTSQVEAQERGSDVGGQRVATDKVEEIEVRGRPRARRETVDYNIVSEQGKKVAGTQGDVLKVVQNLPGVSRPPVASGQLVVWGSPPKDTRVYVDGLDLPALYHGSNLRGTISSDLIASIDLVPGAFGAEYGRGLGGLVRVETRALPSGIHASVGVDTLDGSAFASTAIKERVRVGGAFRYGWLDRVLAAAGAPDVGELFPIPRYRDGQLKATIGLRDRESVDAVFLVSSDELDRTLPSPDPGKRRAEATRSGFWRGYARYINVGAAGTTVMTPFVGHDSSSLVQRFGATPARLAIESDRYGMRGTLRTAIGRHLSLVTGIDAMGTLSRVSREGALTLPPREGDIAVFGQPPGDEYALDTWKTHVLDVGPHAYADVRLGPVTVTPGVRFDAYMIEGTKKLPPAGNVPPIGFSRFETAFAPRASARWNVTRRFALTAAYGNYHQPPEPEELSAVFGTPELALSRATHIVVGESLRVTERTTIGTIQSSCPSRPFMRAPRSCSTRSPGAQRSRSARRGRRDRRSAISFTTWRPARSWSAARRCACRGSRRRTRSRTIVPGAQKRRWRRSPRTNGRLRRPRATPTSSSSSAMRAAAWRSPHRRSARSERVLAAERPLPVGWHSTSWLYDQTFWSLGGRRSLLAEPRLREKSSRPLLSRVNHDDVRSLDLQVVGLSTDEIAQAFVVAPRSMEQRLTRARQRLREKGDVEGTTPEHGYERLAAVLRTIYLLFNEGYWSSAKDAPIRADLCRLAVGLAQSLVETYPNVSEVLGLLALLHTPRRHNEGLRNFVGREAHHL